MKASDYIASILSKHTSIIFGGQGSSVIHLIDSIKKNKKLQFIPGQSEQGSSLAADAYYRTSGKIGVTLGTCGPGIINFLQGMACSYFDSIPSLYIAGAPVVSHLRKNMSIRQIGFQEMEVKNLVKPITKYYSIIRDLKDLDYEFEKAISIAFDKRMGPVLLELPDDIQRTDMPKKLKKFKISKKRKDNKKNLKISKSIDLIRKAKRPLVLVGSGVKLSGSEKLITNFIKKNQIPYTCSWGAADIFSTNDNLNVGSIGVAATRNGNFTLQKADLLICMGIRFNTQLAGGNPKNFAPNAKKILIDIDSNEFKSHRIPKINIKIKANINDYLTELNKINLNLDKNEITKWVKVTRNLKNKFPMLSKKNFINNNYVDPYLFFHQLSNYIKKNSVLIPDASANLIWAYQAFKIHSKIKVFTAFNHSPMGYSIAASVGAYFGDKSKLITATIGDGSVPMNVQELETIKHYNVNVKIFVLNNKGYGLIKQTQETWLKSNYAGVDKKSGFKST